MSSPRERFEQDVKGMEYRRQVATRIAAGETLKGDEADLASSPFVTETLGLRISEIAKHRLVGHMVAADRHHQPYGIVHGGVWCALVESMGSIAGVLHVEEGSVVVGVHNGTDFLRPHREGPVTAVASAIHVGRRQHLWLVEIRRDEDDKMVARGQLRLQVVDAA